MCRFTPTSPKVFSRTTDGLDRALPTYVASKALAASPYILTPSLVNVSFIDSFSSSDISGELYASSILSSGTSAQALLTFSASGTPSSFDMRLKIAVSVSALISCDILALSSWSTVPKSAGLLSLMILESASTSSILALICSSTRVSWLTTSRSAASWS